VEHETPTNSALADAEERFERRQIAVIRARAAFAKSHHEHIRVPLQAVKFTAFAAVASVVTWVAVGPGTPAGAVLGLITAVAVSAALVAIGYLGFSIAESRATPMRLDFEEERFEVEGAALERLRRIIQR
jgi:hypothetical protein